VKGSLCPVGEERRTLGEFPRKRGRGGFQEKNIWGDRLAKPGGLGGEKETIE